VFDDFTLQVVHTPGHSPGSVCLLNTADGTLFSGDTLLQEIFHSPASRASDSEECPRFNTLSAHRASLNRLKNLPVKRVMPGHGATFSDLDKRIQRILGHHGRRSQEILRIAKAHCAGRGQQRGVTAFTVAGDLFPGLSGIDVFFGVSSVGGHLEFLEDQGLVTAVVHRSSHRYYPAKL
jgi:glyoxylase-like metal-dependent hydrolase (beta-lactamase superfamily II)